MEFKRGSEWRKWDLHLHTPSSFDYKGKVTNEEIIETLKFNDISAAVITDHHRIDVERINQLVELGKKENILILPGIELRSELGGRDSIHFIGIFPSENIATVWEKIKGKLDLTDDDIGINGDEIVYKNLEKSCELFHKLGGITTIHAGAKTNSIENLKNKNYLHKLKQKEDILKKSIDILEIGKEKDIKDYMEIVFPDINYKAPLIIGSDNHNIKNYNLKQNCWIKSDLSFEGLKQIIYEPEERVKIQEILPDKKNDYTVIDSVKFEDSNFIDSEIVLNSNLVSIIGGKSTGKSIFLRSIARAIDRDYVEKVSNNFSKLINPNTIIKWGNGKKGTFEDNSENKIIYIPQNFLNNQLTEADPDSFSYKLISDILKSDEDMAIFDKFKKEGYSEPKYLNVSKRVKRDFPVCNEFFRSLTFTIFYARLEDHKNILKFELPYRATEDEIKNILSVIKGNSVEGYPYLLKKAHNDVVIRKTDIERLSKIIGFLEKSGREML
ncbi:MAG: DNA double-strand break repair nuclease NurA [Methanobacterium paludis]|nr:DNA double-strand break repair nuclease NurA [Methanobacterium paludis]